MNNDTQSINPYSNKGNNNNSNNAKKAGIAAGVVGAAAIGTAGAYAFTHDADDAPIVEPEAVVPEEETPIDGAQARQDAPSHRADDHGGRPAHDPAARPDDHHGEDNQHGHNPGEQPGEQPGDNPGEQPGHNPGEQPGDNPGEQPGEQPADNPGEQPTEQEIQEYDDNNLDPDSTVDEVLAQEVIDHEGDSEVTGDMLIHDYEEVGMIYGEDGEAQVAAVAYDPNGTPIMLVDVDGDQMFDNGYYEDGSGVDVSALAINVGDAEYDAAQSDEYLANNGENVDNFDGNDFSEDIIS